MYLAYISSRIAISLSLRDCGENTCHRADRYSSIRAMTAVVSISGVNRLASGLGGPGEGEAFLTLPGGPAQEDDRW